MKKTKKKKGKKKSYQREQISSNSLKHQDANWKHGGKQLAGETDVNSCCYYSIVYEQVADLPN